MASLRRRDMCQHPEVRRIVDPLDENRGLCGVCGAAWASPKLHEDALNEVVAAQRWRQEWFKKGD